MVGAAEVEVDKETGQIDVIDYVGVIDCGTPINPNLARVQAEGGIGQGIDTPCPAIANAVYNATGVRVRELPITPEKVAMGILAREAGEKV